MQQTLHYFRVNHKGNGRLRNPQSNRKRRKLMEEPNDNRNKNHLRRNALHRLVCQHNLAAICWEVGDEARRRFPSYSSRNLMDALNRSSSIATLNVTILMFLN